MSDGKGQFVGPLRLERTGPMKAILLEPFRFISPTLGLITVEQGFDTDYASVPRPLWSLYPPDGSYTDAAIIHDYLYWYQPCTRAQADEVFREGMIALGVPVIRRNILYRAVRMGGGGPWKNNQKLKAIEEGTWIEPQLTPKRPVKHYKK